MNTHMYSHRLIEGNSCNRKHLDEATFQKEVIYHMLAKLTLCQISNTAGSIVTTFSIKKINKKMLQTKNLGGP